MKCMLVHAIVFAAKEIHIKLWKNDEYFFET